MHTLSWHFAIGSSIEHIAIKYPCMWMNHKHPLRFNGSTVHSLYEVMNLR